MRYVTKVLPLALGIMALICPSVLAGKNQGGALVVHTDDLKNYTSGVCNLFDTWYPGILCPDLVTRTDKSDALPVLLWFIAAFPQSSNPGVQVIYFGNDHNLPPAQGYHANWGFCGPAGSFELADAGWPEAPATAGNSLAFGSPVVGDKLFPFYYFNVYGFTGAYYCTDMNPVGGYASFEDDSNPPQTDTIDNFGCVRWYVAGYNECPSEGPLPGACCFASGACQMANDLDACLAAGGYRFEGSGTTCTPNPCPQPGACCFADGHCEYLLEANCTGDLWIPGTDCDPNPCPQQPPTGACCQEDGDCTVTTEATCAEELWIAGIGCDPNPCKCEEEDNGHGTVDLPPDCPYVNPYEVHMILDGLPDSTTIELDPRHHSFTNIQRHILQDGSEVEVFDSRLDLIITGTGKLIGFNRFLPIDLHCEVHTAPRDSGACVQRFDTDLFQAVGTITGDPDFAELTITAGTDFDLPSPGRTTLTRLDGGMYNVDSFFDVTYQIHFEGGDDPSPLHGLSGDTEPTTVRMEAGTAGEPTGACCDDAGACTLTTEVCCTEELWIEGADCDPNPCPPTGACCYACQECIVLTQAACIALPDDYQWIEGEVCEPNPCPPTAIETTTWGRIKSTYK